MRGAALAFLLLTLGTAALIVTVLLWRSRERTQRQPQSTPLAAYRIRLPRETRFSPAHTTAFFSHLAPLLSRSGTPPSVEIRGEGRELVLLICVPLAWEAPLRAQLSAWLPGARLELFEEAEAEAGPAAVFLPLGLEKPALYPLRMPGEGEPDPLLGVLALLAAGTERCGLRLLWGPEPPGWNAWAQAALTALRAGQPLPPQGRWFLLVQLYRFFQEGSARRENAAPSGAQDPVDLPGIERKARGPVFQARLLLWAEGESEELATARVRALAAQLQIGSRDPLGNGLVPAGAPRPLNSKEERNRVAGPTMALSAVELAALFHLPEGEHPLLSREESRQAPPPVRFSAASVEDGTARIGEALTGEGPVPFGLGMEERRLHTYLVGKTGTGKSTLLATLARQDLQAARGVGLIDPHGDLAERVLALVPAERMGEVLYFNPADRDYPAPFNPLACTAPERRLLVASGVVGVFKKLWGDSWGPRLEHFLRNALLALLETPSPSLLLLPRLLTDRSYRARVVPLLRDPVLRSFFQREYEAYDPRWRAEAISPILNKVGQFLASPLVRNVVGGTGPGFDLRQLMDRGGIFVANLASGKIGEDNAALLGGLLVAGFQLAAMSRADLPEGERRDFSLLVDEFQHFAGEAFAGILSEARKYRLSLTLSHQYLDQLPPPILDAVLGNVGSLLVFRVGAPDTTRLVRELAPRFDAEDLVHLPNHHFCARITRAGVTVPAFSARTVPLAESGRDLQPLIEKSRARWSRPRAEVELEIADLWEGRAD